MIKIEIKKLVEAGGDLEDVAEYVYNKYLIDLAETVEPTSTEVLFNRLKNERVPISYARLPKYSFKLENTTNKRIILEEGQTLSSGEFALFMPYRTTIEPNEEVEAFAYKGFSRRVEKPSNLKVKYSEFAGVNVKGRLYVEDGLMHITTEAKRLTLYSFKYKEGFEAVPKRLTVLNTTGLITSDIQEVEPYLPPMTNNEFKSLLINAKDRPYPSVDRCLLESGVREFKYRRVNGILEIMSLQPIPKEALKEAGVTEYEIVEPIVKDIKVDIKYEKLVDEVTLKDFNEVLEYPKIVSQIPKDIEIAKELIGKIKGVYFVVTTPKEEVDGFCLYKLSSLVS